MAMVLCRNLQSYDRVAVTFKLSNTFLQPSSSFSLQKFNRNTVPLQRLNFGYGNSKRAHGYSYYSARIHTFEPISVGTLRLGSVIFGVLGPLVTTHKNNCCVL